jgi:hypothetical protein
MNYGSRVEGRDGLWKVTARYEAVGGVNSVVKCGGTGTVSKRPKKIKFLGHSEYTRGDQQRSIHPLYRICWCMWEDVAPSFPLYKPSKA